MSKGPRLQPVYASINRPLTIGGADRRLFFVAVVVGGATFTLFGSLLAGLLMFLALYLAARWVTHRDPQLLRIVLRSASARSRYDPGKFDYLVVRREGRPWNE
jgi:type IV secretory pathway TrbD component